MNFNQLRRFHSLKMLIATPLFLILAQKTNGQTNTIQIQDSKQKNIVDAAIYIDNSYQGLTNNQGVFVKKDIHTPVSIIQIKHLGYKTYSQEIRWDTASQKIFIKLENEDNMDDVIVTAGRRAENISTVPSSVTILSEKDIATQSQINTNLTSILGNTVPGLAVSSNRATNAGQTLRGRAVLVLIDGIPQSTPLMNGARDLRTIDPNVIERIEVIKGATSIYGNGSAGGIINYITKKPKGQKAISGLTTVRGTANPFHNSGTAGYRVSQLLNGNIGKWSYVVSGSMEYFGVQRDGKGNVVGTTDGLSNSYQYNAFAKLAYRINTTSSIDGLYNFYSSTSHAKYINKNGVYGDSAAVGIRGVDPGKPAGTPFNHNAMLHYSKSGLWGYTQLDVTAYLNSFTSMNRYVTSTTSWYGPGQTKINSRKKGLRINLNTPFDIDNHLLELTYGLDVLRDVTYQDLTDGRVYIPKMKMTNLAPYAQVKFNILNDLIFKGGVRYENATVRINNFQTIATGANNSGSVAVQGGKIPYKATTFNAGLRYNKYEFFNPFVSFSQGFAINELGRIVRSARNSDLDSLKTDPIVTNNYEVGFSSHFGILDLSASYYISTSKLGVELVANDNGYLEPLRLPERLHGYEFALSVTPSKYWKLGGTYAYVEGKATASTGAKTYLNGTRIAPPKVTGYLNFTPTSSWNIQLSYLNTGHRARFSKNTKNLYNASEGPVYANNLFNFAASYAINKAWSLGLGVDNLFNKDYYTVSSQSLANNATYFKGPGTTASFNINYRF